VFYYMCFFSYEKYVRIRLVTEIGFPGGSGNSKWRHLFHVDGKLAHASRASLWQVQIVFELDESHYFKYGIWDLSSHQYRGILAAIGQSLEASIVRANHCFIFLFRRILWFIKENYKITRVKARSKVNAWFIYISNMFFFKSI